MITKIFVRCVMWLLVVTLICDVFLFVRWVMWLLVVTHFCDHKNICQMCDVTTSSHLFFVITNVLWKYLSEVWCDYQLSLVFVILFVRYVMWLLVVTDILWYHNICQRCDVTTGSHRYLWYYFICQKCDVTTSSHTYLWYHNICQKCDVTTGSHTYLVIS